MATTPTMHEILDNVEYLFEHYSLERRATTQPYLVQVIKESVPDYPIRPDDPLVRETLLEHVGSLPVIATALYPYIDDPEVDLGQALIMLAIHDIGELATGDEITFTKQKVTAQAEQEAALKLLPRQYHELYKDVESKSSKTAKFAKAIDKITPDILDYLTPVEVTVPRLKHFVGIDKDQIVDTIVQHKRPYMLWNRF